PVDYNHYNLQSFLGHLLEGTRTAKEEIVRSAMVPPTIVDYQVNKDAMRLSSDAIPVEHLGEIIRHVWSSFQSVNYNVPENRSLVYFPFASYLEVGMKIGRVGDNKQYTLIGIESNPLTGGVYHNPRYKYMTGQVVKL